MSIPIPRIQGQAYERDDKRFAWEMKISFGPEEPIFMRTPDDHVGFETKELAIADLKEKSNTVVEEMSKIIGEKPTGFYNLKTNTFDKIIK